VASDHQESEIDYRSEILENINALFDGYSVRVVLHQDYGDTRYNPSLLPPYTGYSLRIEIEISIAAALKYSELSSMGALNRGIIGSYRPDSINQYQDFQYANTILIFQYNISSLNDFVTQLKKHAWTVYSTRMNDAIDSILDKK
jgi:hypothetical protein